MKNVGLALPHWALIYRTGQSRMDGYGGYGSVGVLVPLSDLDKIAEAVVEIGS